MNVEASDKTGFSFLKGGGEMGKILLAQDWKASLMGSAVLWQQSLKNSLNNVLNSNFPCILLWGFKYICFYNDSYKSCIAPNADPLFFGQSGIDLFSDRLPVSKNIVDQILSEKKIIHSEELLVPVLVDGKKKNLDCTFHYNPVYDDLGNTGGVLVSCYEFTSAGKYFSRLNNFDDQIIEAEEKARLAIESADLGTYELNLVTNEVKTSARFNKIWGVETDFAWSQLAARIHPDDLDTRAAAHNECSRTGNLHYEARVIHKDGSHHWVKVKGRVSHDNSGQPLMLVGVIQDITEQKTFTNDLSKLVQERTEELQALNEELVATNEELIESNSHFTRVNKELEQFAYVASHDLQEPLRKIQTFASILNERFTEELSPGAAVYMEKITASASRMSSLIKDLLDYSRLTYNSSLFKVVDLNVIVNHVINDFELLTSQKGITINVDPLPSIEAIPIQMNQLFYNLISNSIKFSKKSVKPIVTIAARILASEQTTQYPNLKSNRAYLEFTISDNGIGFSQQYAEQIFTIFQRLNDKSKYGGYGIGLALCKRIIENHDGIMSAKGTENEGATFVCVLPIKR